MEKGEIAPVSPVEKIHKELPKPISKKEEIKKKKEEKDFGEIFKKIRERNKKKEEKEREGEKRR